MCINNKIYEISSSATSLPSPIYTHSDTDIVFSSITASGPAIYVAGYSGTQSSIFKFTLNTSGVMPTLTTAITAAEMPVGEIIHKIYYYLGYMMIGTNKGIRAAIVSDQDGSINYGNTDYYAYLLGIRTFANPEVTNINVLVTPGVDYVNNSNLVESAIDMIEYSRADSLYVCTTPDYNMYVPSTGNQLDLENEIASQVGSLAEFQQMNVIAQGSLAKAFGLSRSELADMLLQQEAINRYGDAAAKLNKDQSI
jgi:hypothetical protein